MSEKQFSISLRLVENYLFNIDFGEFGNLLADEPEPIGAGEGPNPAAMLAASVANCLCASLLFAVRKYKEDPGEINAKITGTMGRIDGLLRITHFSVDINLGVASDTLQNIDKVLTQFENFCTVTQSVRRGIAVDVNVSDSEGKSLLSQRDSV
ncbi:MAG: OsmC family protein [Pseudohongiellaceae bacterium]|nr:OsmC family protein [Pseudohongiellaceae bacterium]